MKKLRKLWIVVFVMAFCLLTLSTNAQQPYASYWFPNDLLQWTPASDPDAEFNRGSIPLADRFAGNGVNSNAMAEPKIQILTTMNPSTSENPSQGSDVFDIYAFNYWQYIDSLVMWGGSASEGMIVTPSADVIDVAHKNGVKVLGCINFQPDYYGGQLQWVRDLIQENPVGTFPGADKLIEVAEYYGFDGWFMHQETQGGNVTDANQMQAFLKYFQANKPAGMEMHWYDSMVSSGGIDYENALTSKNEMFFQDGTDLVSHGFFTNYWWSDMSTSRDKAISLGRSQYDVYAGINSEPDGYNVPSNSSFYVDWPGVFPEGQPAKTSLGIFRPDWTFRNATSADDFYTKANRYWVGENRDPSNTQTTDYWKGLAHYIIAKSPLNSLPFTTNFNTGNGHIYAVNGEVKRNRDWNNRSLQDVMPTWRWIVDSTGTALYPSIDWTTAYYGGSSLKVTGDLSPQNATHIKLYKADLPVASNTELSVTFKTPSNESYMQVGLSFTDNPGQFVYLDAGTAVANDWTTNTISLSQYSGKNIEQISLNFDSSTTVSGYTMNVGQVSIRNADSNLLPAVSGLTVVDNEFREGLYADARLKWNELAGDVEVYEVYRVKSDGTKEFVGATPNNVYYVPEMRRDGYETQTTLEVVALDKNYDHGQVSQATIQWPPYPTPVSEFVVSKTLITPGETVTFYNKSSEATETITWDFPSGSPISSTDENPQVTYNTEGTYDVTLTATNAVGQDVETKNALITVSNSITVNNVAIGKSTSADTFVSGEEPSKAVDGSTSTKWCATGPEPHWMVVNLGAEYTISEFIVKHAEAGGEGSGYNTSDFKIQLSNDGSNWTDVVDVQGNTAGVSNHAIALTAASYVRLYITDAGGDTAARIYEFEVMGYQDGGSSTLPGNFNLLTPSNGAKQVSRVNTYFNWEDSSLAVSYQIIVDNNSDFSSPEINVSGITTSDYTSTITLNARTTYYWKVIAINNDGSTESNSVYNFKTANK